MVIYSSVIILEKAAHQQDSPANTLHTTAALFKLCSAIYLSHNTKHYTDHSKSFDRTVLPTILSTHPTHMHTHTHYMYLAHHKKINHASIPQTLLFVVIYVRGCEAHYVGTAATQPQHHMFCQQELRFGTHKLLHMADRIVTSRFSFLTAVTLSIFPSISIM